MSHLLNIGEFARLTHLSVKALRHYDDLGLLRPASVDASSGYRLYAAAQVPTAQLIRRFRDLEMPLEDIRTVLAARSLDQRDGVVVEHLRRMEAKLDQTRSTVASLRELLDGRGWDLPVEHRRLPATPVLALRQVIAWDETDAWLTDALTELDAAVEAGRHHRTGPDGALYSDAFFQAHLGEVVAFVPIAPPAAGRRPPRRVDLVDLPAVDVAVTVHTGAFSDIDTTYGALGTYVNERLIGADGPIREHYLDTAAGDDPDQARVEVCWPIRPDGPASEQLRTEQPPTDQTQQPQPQTGATP